jgi:hypothetical protein
MTFVCIANAVVITTGSTATSTKGPPTNSLSRTTTSILNTGAASVTVQVEVSDTDFVPTVSDIFTAASGSFVDAAGSTITFNWYVDRANALFGTTELIDTFSFTVPGAAEAFSHILRLTC